MISTAMGKWMWRIVLMRMARLELYSEMGTGRSRNVSTITPAATIVCGHSQGPISTATARQISLIGTSKMASVIGCLPFGWGNGNGTFQPETAVNLPDNIKDLGIVPGDFNSDGLLDFIMLPAAGGIQVYPQK
jgi:hypothetical protein